MKRIIVRLKTALEDASANDFRTLAVRPIPVEEFLQRGTQVVCILRFLCAALLVECQFHSSLMATDRHTRHFLMIMKGFHSLHLLLWYLRSL